MDERMNESSSAMANGGGSPACLPAWGKKPRTNLVFKK
jgi:hypothetical protein